MTSTIAERKRGGCLTAWLVLILIANPLTAIYYLTSGSQVARVFPSMPGWVIPVLVVGAILNTIFGVGLWTWHKWGAYGLYASAAVALAINLTAGLGATAFLGAIGAVILYFLVRPVWTQFS